MERGDGDGEIRGASDIELPPNESLKSVGLATPITRRALLGSVGGLAVLTVDQAFAAGNDPDLVISFDTKTLNIGLGTTSWEIDLRSVSDSTHVDVKPVSNDKIQISLSANLDVKATALPVRLYLERKPGPVDRRWHLSVEVSFVSAKHSASVLLSDFLGQRVSPAGGLGSAPASVKSLPSISLSAAEASSLLTKITSTSISSPAMLDLSMLPNLSWHLAAPSDKDVRSYTVKLGTPGLEIAAEGVRLGRAAADENPGWLAHVGDVKTDRSVLAFVVVEGRAPDKTWILGKKGQKGPEIQAEVSFGSGSIHASAECYPAATAGTGTGETIMVGMKAGRIGSVRFLGDVPVMLPIVSAEVAWVRSNRTNSPWRTRARLALPEKPFVATFSIGMVCLHGGENVAPLELREKVDKKDLGRLEVAGEVSVIQIFRRVSGTDFSRFDIGGKAVRLVTPGSEQAGGFIEVGGQAALARIPLDNATLRIRRSADLLALSYRFSGLALQLEPNSACFVCLDPAPDLRKEGDAAQEPEALLIVELPPQHVDEQIFYRSMPEKTAEDGSSKSGRPGDSDVVITNVFVDEVAIRKAVESRIAAEMGLGVSEAKKAEFQAKVEQDLPKAILDEKLKDRDYQLFHKKLKERYPDADLDTEGGRAHALEIMRELQDKDPDAPGRLTKLARARLSGPTRVAFVIPAAQKPDVNKINETDKKGKAAEAGKPASGMVLAYTADALTDFSRLDMKVVRRATYFKPEESTTSAVAELKAYGIEASVPDTPPLCRWTTRMARIRDLMQRPSAHETSIELPTRVMLSPDNHSRWRTPTAPAAGWGSGTPVPLWRMQLDLEARATPQVRAVWSPDFNADVFGAGGLRERSVSGYRTAMDAFDRHQLVTLSSLPGLPVLPRQRADGGLEGGQFAPPPGFEIGGAEGRPEAIYRPVPLAISELTLTTLGGSISHDTAFEPPAGIDHMHKASSAMTLSVERWKHVTVLGRDVSVEVVYKGFLFPLGHRCSLVKVTERVFLRGYGSIPTAYLIQRIFLRTGRPVKRFPALYHPDQSRRWPVNQVELLTKRSPDIKDPLNVVGTPVNFVRPSGRILELPSQFVAGSRESQKLKGLVFWPRVENGAKSDVIFNIKIDESASLVRMPLIFVDNIAAHDPATMNALCRYYDSLSQQSGNNPAVVSHGGIARRYAEEKRRDTASYETIDWTFSAEGRTNSNDLGNAKGVNSYFEMDALMEGADQPPFYPFVKKATIRVKQLEQLSGGVARPVSTHYIEGYRLGGFEGSNQKIEAFLELDDGVPLSFANAGDKSGGVAKPDITAKALSRSQGPVGEASDKKSGANADFSHFNDINPDTLFKDAKLLGIVKFSTLLKQLGGIALSHPKISQYIDYAFPDSARKTIQGTLEKLAHDIDQYAAHKWPFKVGDLQSTFKLRDALPRLEKTLNEVSIGAREVARAIGDTNPGALLSGGVELYEASQRLLSEIDRIVEDPVAPLKANAQKLLLDLQAAVLGEIASQLRGGSGEFLTLLKEMRDAYSQLEHDFALRLRPDVRATPERDAAADLWRMQVLGLPAFMNITDAPIVANASRQFSRELIRLAKESTGIADDEAALLRDFIDRARFTSHFQQACSAFASEILKEKPPRGPRLAELYRQFNLRASMPLPYAYDRLASAVEPIYGLAERLAASAALKPQEALDRILADIRKVVSTYLEATRDKLSVEVSDACQTAVGAMISLAIAELPTAPTSSQEALQCDINSEAPATGAMTPTCQGIRSILMTAATTLKQMRKLRDDLQANPADTPHKGELLNAVDDLIRACTDSIEAIKNNLTALFAAITSTGEAWRKVNLAAGVDTVEELESWLKSVSETACSSFQIKAIEPWLADIPRAAADVGRAAQTTLVTLTSKITEINAAAQALSKPEMLDAAITILLDAERLHMTFMAGIMRLAHPVSELLLSSTVTFEAVSADPSSFRSLALTKARRTVEQFSRDAQGGIFERLFGSKPDDPRIVLLAEFSDKIGTAVTTLRNQKNPLDIAADDIDRALIMTVDIARHTRLQDIRRTIAADSAIDKWLSDLGETIDAIRFDLLANIRSTLRDVSSLEQTGFDLLREPMARVLDPTLDFATHLYTRIEEVRRPLLDPLENKLGVFANALKLDKALIVEPITGGHDRISSDKMKLEALAKETTQTVIDRNKIAAALSVFENPSPVILIKKIIETIETILRGDIGRFIDLEQLKNRIIDDTKDLTPARLNLDYDFAMPVSPSDAIREFFDLWKGGDGPDPSNYIAAFNRKAFTEIGQPTNGNAHLVIRTRTRIDLLNKGKVTSTAEGYLHPFKVGLFGKSLDVVTMYFDGAHFKAGSDVASDFKIKLIDTKLGDKVAFLEKIQAWLNGGSGNGFKLKFQVNPLGIEASYGLALPVISIGTVSFSNVSLQAGVVLPFEQGEALFRVALSSRDNPFLISAAPFGGGGHLALLANAERIVGFEASFEYGGVAAFGFGPMQGIGRLTTGFYVSNDALRGATIQGHFFVGGSARVWIFGVAASLAVRIGQANGGEMCGSAVFSYSFSFGLDDIEFHVAVWRQEGKSFNSDKPKTAYLTPAGPTQLAALVKPGVLSDADPINFAQAGTGNGQTAGDDKNHYRAIIQSNVFPKERRWDRYNAYFDTSLEPED